MEKLTPFDFAEFEKDPMRLRSGSGERPIRADVVFGDSVAVTWGSACSCAFVYLRHEFGLLQLAAKTRIVKVRLYRDGWGGVFAMTDTHGDKLDDPDNHGHPWISDIIEVEVTE